MCAGHPRCETADRRKEDEARMNIVVCVKYVPDAQSDRTFQESDNTVDRDAVDGLLSELDEYAVEEALKIVEAAGEGEVTVVTVGPEAAADAIKKSLQMGAAQGRPRPRRRDRTAPTPSPPRSSSPRPSKKATDGSPDLVLTGMSSTDGVMGVVPAMIAERLGLPQVTYASELTVVDGDGHDPPRRRHRLRDHRGHAAGPGLGHRPDQRAALPLVQGDHGREEEAGRDAGRSPTSVSTPVTSASTPRGPRSIAFAKRPPRDAGPDRHRRGRRRHQARRVPRRPEVPLTAARDQEHDTWLKYSSSSTTPAAPAQGDRRAADHRPPSRRALRGLHRPRSPRPRRRPSPSTAPHKVYVVDDADVAEYLVAPAGRDPRASSSRRPRPRPCSSRATPPARRSPPGSPIKTESGLITDAVDVRPATTAWRPRSRSSPAPTRCTATVTTGHADHLRQAELGRHRGRARGRRRRGRRGRPSATPPRPRGSPTRKPEEGHRSPRAHRGRDRRLRRSRHRRRLRRRSRSSPTASVPPSAPRAPPSTPAGTRTATRSARPASRSRRSSTSRRASPVRSSTAPACRRPRRSSPSTRTRRRRSSSSSTSASSVTSSPSLPQATERGQEAQGLSTQVASSPTQRV